MSSYLHAACSLYNVNAFLRAYSLSLTTTTLSDTNIDTMFILYCEELALSLAYEQDGCFVQLILVTQLSGLLLDMRIWALGYFGSKMLTNKDDWYNLAYLSHKISSI